MTAPRVAAAQAFVAARLLDDFANRTGVGPRSRSGPRARARRYLWTDAYAVCAWVELARTTGDARYTTLALDLVDAVHTTLGRHCSDHDDDRNRRDESNPSDASVGDDDPAARPLHDGNSHACRWLDGASTDHPTRGGLRIGKKLPERKPGEPVDDEREWDRDGQYFHYLTATLSDGAARGLQRWLPLRERIVRFWLDPTHCANATWRAHEDIDDVMLAASLRADGFVGSVAPAASA